MSLTHTPVRRSLVAAVALGAGLTLAACGGGDDAGTVAPAPEPAPPAEEETSEEVPSDPESGSEDAGESESDAGALLPGGESESEVGSAGGESASGATGEERIDFTAPEGWEDISGSAEIPVPQGVTEMHTLVPEGDLSGTTTMGLTTFDETATGGASSYVEMIEATGGDTSAFTELEPRDIGGHEADGIEGEMDLGTGALRQVAYGVVLDDGSLVQILVIAPAEEFDQHQAAFDELVDSVEIN